MLNIKTRRQVDEGGSYKCGPYAMEAVLRFFGCGKTADDVWDAATVDRGIGGQKVVSTIGMVRFAMDNGVYGTIYRSRNMPRTLNRLDKLGATAVLCVAFRHPGDRLGHYIVYRGKEDGLYHFADPGKEEEEIRTMTGEELSAFCRKTGPEVTGNNLVAFQKNAPMKTCTHCGRAYPLAWWEELKGNVRYPICCWCDNADEV